LADGIEIIQAIERRHYDIILMGVQISETCDITHVREYADVGPYVLRSYPSPPYAEKITEKIFRSGYGHVHKQAGARQGLREVLRTHIVEAQLGEGKRPAACNHLSRKLS